MSLALRFILPLTIFHSQLQLYARGKNTRPIPFITYTPPMPNLHNIFPLLLPAHIHPHTPHHTRSCRFLYTHHSSPQPTISWLLHVLLSTSRHNVGVHLECPAAPLDVPHWGCSPGSGHVPAGDSVAPSCYRFACVEFLESKGGSMEEIPTRRNAHRMGV